MKNNSELFKNKRLIAFISLVFAMLFWSGNTLLTRASVGEIPPLALAFYRWTIAAIILLVINHKSIIAHRNTILKEYKKILFLALLGITLYSSIIYSALQTTTAINANMIGSSGPLITTLLAWCVLKEKTNIIQSASILLACAGVGIVISKGSLYNLITISFNHGDLLVIAAVITWSSYSIFVQKWSINLPPFVLLTLLACIGIIGLFPLYCIESTLHGMFVPTATTWPTIFYLAIFPSIISFSLWLSAVKELGSALTALFGYMQMIFTTTFACLFLNEQLHFYQIAGGLCTLLGLYLYTTNKSAIHIQESH